MVRHLQCLANLMVLPMYQSLMSSILNSPSFQIALPQLLFPPVKSQLDVVFNKDTFPNRKYPPLAGFWTSGLSLTGFRLAAYQMGDRKTVRIKTGKK